MTSHVIYGSLTQCIWTAEYGGDKAIFDLNTRIVKRHGNVKVYKIEQYKVSAGESYYQMDSELHTTEISEPCITVMSYAGPWMRSTMVCHDVDVFVQPSFTISDEQKLNYLDEFRQCIGA